MPADLLEQIGPKVFACNFAGVDAKPLLSYATEGLGQIKDGMAKSQWNLARNIDQHPEQPGVFYVFHTVTFKVGAFSGLVTLTLSAVPLNLDIEGVDIEEQPPRLLPVRGALPMHRPYRQGRRDRPSPPPPRRDAPYICRLTADFASRGWEYGSEDYADYAMQIMSGFLRRKFRNNSGWYMVQGIWNGSPRFQCPRGTPPDIPELWVEVPRPRPQLEGLAGELAAAHHNATLSLKPGNYRDVPNIDKPLTLVGDGRPGSVVLTISDKWRIMAGAHPVMLRNLVIELEQVNSQLFVEDSLILDGCSIRGGLVQVGPGLSTGAPNAPRRLELRGCSVERSWIELRSGEFKAEDTRFSEVEYEAIVALGGRVELKNATFRRCGKCAISADGASVVMEGCDIALSPYGVLAKESRVQLRNCTIAAQDPLYLDSKSTLEKVNTTLGPPLSGFVDIEIDLPGNS